MSIDSTVFRLEAEPHKIIEASPKSEGQLLDDSKQLVSDFEVTVSISRLTSVLKLGSRVDDSDPRQLLCSGRGSLISGPAG